MEHVELVTVSSETDSDEAEDELENGQEDFNPLIRGGDSTKSRAQIKRTRLVYDPTKEELKTSKKCTWKRICLGVMGLIIICVSVFIFLTGEEEEPVSKVLAPSLDYMDFKQPKNMISYRDIMEDNFRFNLSSSSDVMVFLHIQKTGGTTFGKHLVQDIDLENPCLCHRRRNRLNRRKLHCDCFRPGTEDRNWLFSRYSYTHRVSSQYGRHFSQVQHWVEVWSASRLDRAHQLCGQVLGGVGGWNGGQKVFLHHLPKGPSGQVSE